MANWQPIETAPKDGTQILWCAWDGGEPPHLWCSVIRWPEYDNCFHMGWWQPLPNPPPRETST